MAKNDLEKESNNLSIIVVLSLFLILCLGYIAYDMYFSKLGPTEKQSTGKNETNEKAEKEVYNKDGIFIQDLMKGIVYESYSAHEENNLYLKDKTTVEDLPEEYRNTLVHRAVGKEYFTTEELARASKKLFGKNIYSSFPQTLNVYCKKYELRDNTYAPSPIEGGCGGAGYRYYSKTTKVESDDNHIYVYQAVGYQCPEGVCKDVEKTGDYSYKYSNPVKELDNPMTEVNMDELVEKLHTYKFTFTYDTTENIYYFESVEKES